MIQDLRQDRSQQDLHAAVVDELLPPLAETLYRVAANLVTVETGNIPTLFEIERKGGALAKALGNLLSFASDHGFYTLQSARYAEDFFANPVRQKSDERDKSDNLSDLPQAEAFDLQAEIDDLLGDEASPPLPALPKRRKCHRTDCKRTFKPRTRHHIYCSTGCKSVVHTREKRAAEKASKAS